MGNLRARFVAALGLVLAGQSFAGTINHYPLSGTGYGAWPSTWSPVPSLNDGLIVGRTTPQFDVVGNANSPAFYLASNNDYLFFRVRSAYSGTVTTGNQGTFSGTMMILVDAPSQGVSRQPDYGFAWDTKGPKQSGQETSHGLELTRLGTAGSSWKTTSMEDVDGSAGQKLAPDFNNTGDGYVRTIDNQPTTDFGNTTLVDYAISWSFLQANTTLRKGQLWNLQVVTMNEQTDHAGFSTDVGGAANPDDAPTLWSNAVPEPGIASALLGGVVGGLALRFRRSGR